MNKSKFLWILVIAVTVFIAACTSHKKEGNDNTIQGQDTAGLAEYQKWKMENELREKIETENQEARQTIVAAPVKSASSARSSSSRGSQTYHSNGTYTSGEDAASAPTSAPAPQKKGMSHTAKGAIVGAASGAVIGAVANKKNRVGGGVVGGVIGAATGAGVGAIVDKKEKQKNDN